IDCVDPLPIRALSRTDLGDPTLPDQVTLVDPRPTAGSPLLTTDRVAPNDGFFEPVAFRGAFADENWADGWTNTARLGYFPAKPTVTVSADITASTTWTADTIYELDKVIYVTNGATLTIEPCTVVRGQPESSPGAQDPGALVISRDSKIQALGSEDCPIVFTDLFDDNIGANPGTPPYDSPLNALSLTSQWGGLILLGRSYVAFNTAGGPDPARENQIEGLTASGGLGLYGNCAAVYDPVADPAVCDEDDSGTVRYVSLRYGGFNLSPDNEINGLTLGAVGRQTDIDYVEIFQNKDDGIEFFGGVPEVRHAVIVNPGDDGFDYDEGFRGKVQYGLLIQGLPGSGADKSDLGGEHDGGNSPDSSQPFAIPTFYNMTYIGHGVGKGYTNELKDTVVKFRDNAGGRYYNSFFMDFGGAPLLIEGGATDPTAPNTSGERSITAYPSGDPLFPGPVSDFQLELQDNTWYCIGNGPNVPTGDATAFNGDAGKQYYDNGAFTNPALDNLYIDCVDPLPIRALSRTDLGDPTLPDQVTLVDPRP
ncbi:MAG: hypothetical protein D6816_03755, partial [Bacteroidetes bacterium]